jgi:hypothetical protein
VRIVCLGTASDALEKIVAANGLSAEQLAEISRRLSPINLHAGMARAMEGERVAFGGWAFERLAGKGTTGRQLAAVLGSDSAPAGWLLRLYGSTGFFRLEYADYIDRTRRITLEIRNGTRSPAEQKEVIDEICRDIPSYHVLTRIVMPTLSTVALKAWSAQQKIGVTVAGLALERHRQARGDYPQELSALVPEFLPELPKDHFSGIPLRYKRAAHGAIVYSIGANQRDEDGIMAAPKDDLAWRAGDYLAGAK